LGLPKPKPASYNLRMVDQTMTKSMGLITDLNIYVHGILYIITFTALQNTTVDSNYSMLLGRPWLRDAKVTPNIWEVKYEDQKYYCAIIIKMVS
jgi:hypothetical protein